MEPTYTQNLPPLSIGEAARRLGVSVDTVRRWADDGTLPAIILPKGHRRFRVEDIDAIIAARGGAA